MVSTLFQACAAGDYDAVVAALNDGTADLEVKDHTGCTPLIEAIKNGHVKIVQALLDKGADPRNGTGDASPEQFTTDVAILDLLATARDKADAKQQNVGDATGVVQDYPYFPSISGPQPDGAAYYQQQQQQQPQQPNGDGPIHLPPADVARMIPCRYFPACRYGASCMFLHPTGPYYPPPPAQYPVPYDPSMPPYPAYYPTPAYPPPPNGALMSPSAMGGAHPLPPPHPMVHTRSSSEVPSPASAHPYSAPPGPAPPMPYGPLSPISPTGYPHPVQMMPPMGPLHHSAPQSPPMYPNGPGPYLMPHENGTGNTFAQHLPNGVPYPPPPPPPQSNPTSPDGPGHYRNESFNRRGGFRRPSIGRKPPCFFYPVGKCKNGDECRFPHIMPADDSAAGAQGAYSGKGLGPRRSFHNGSLEDKMRNMSIRENGFDGRGRYPTMRNGNKQMDKKTPTKAQRVPEPDEFPVLAGSTSRSHSPGSSSSLNGSNSGPTAAQVLQRPAPTKRDGTKESSPEPAWQPLQDKPELLNGALPDVTSVTMKPLSFAAVATVA